MNKDRIRILARTSVENVITNGQIEQALEKCIERRVEFIDLEELISDALDNLIDDLFDEYFVDAVESYISDWLDSQPL